MDLNFKYLDEKGNYIDGSVLYETEIDGKTYAICCLHHGTDNNDICAFKVIKDGQKHTLTQIDENDDLEKIMNQLNEILKEED